VKLLISLLPLAALAHTPAEAEDAIQFPLFDGALILTAEGGIRQDVRAPDGALLDFWRPVTFGPEHKPIGGRMDCKLAGVRQDYSDALFDIRERYRESRPARELSGLEDEGDDYADNGTVRRLEVTGRAAEPHRHYVLTFLAYRADPYLYDIRLNCEFRHLDEPGRRTDYAAIMRQYVDIAAPLTDTPPASQDTAAPTPSDS
jgi:hypothetical protein